jgi:hypothetical protein
MKEHDPLKDPYNRPYTDEEIKELYLKFRKAYYDELVSHRDDRTKVNKILDIAKPISYKAASSEFQDSLSKLKRLVEVLVSENIALRREKVDSFAKLNNPIVRFIVRFLK